MWDVAVIGAGLSGLTCAQKLKGAGLQVCILDKSRGLGGRMATRRVSLSNSSPSSPSGQAPSNAPTAADQQIRVDHGLRYWQPESEGLKALTQELLSAGVLHEWNVSAYEILQREAIAPVESEAPVYVAAEGMSAIAKALTGQLANYSSTRFTPDDDLLTHHRAVKLTHAEDHWEIECDNGAVTFARRCALAIPARQAADLLSTLPITPENEAIADALSQLSAVSYHPCLTVLAGYDAKYAADMGELDAGGWMVTDKVGTSTDWVCLDSSKRRESGPGPVIVIHSKPDFAQQYLDNSDLQPAASVLLRASARKFRGWIAQPDWFQVHRWRYAQVRQAHPEPALTPVPSLVCGGDWCSEQAVTDTTGAEMTGIDRAYLSGLAMAKLLQSG